MLLVGIYGYARVGIQGERKENEDIRSYRYRLAFQILVTVASLCALLRVGPFPNWSIIMILLHSFLLSLLATALGKLETNTGSSYLFLAQSSTHTASRHTTKAHHYFTSRRVRCI